MGADQQHDWREAAASALEWWRDAGVDTIVAELPRDWLAAEPKPAPKAAVTSAQRAAEPAVPATVRAPLPDTLEAFLGWRTSAEAPEAQWGEPLIAPSGPGNADLMVLVDMPEADDSQTGMLVSGAAGRLLDRMLAAIGYNRATASIAALAVARPIAERLPPEAEPQLAELLRHHLALAAPRRVLVMGQAVSRALLGTDGVQVRNALHRINHGAGYSALVVSHHPRLLLERPGLKAQAWKDLQLLMGGSQ